MENNNKYVYQVYIVDEYNNAYQIGFFNNLDEAIEPINSFLNIYNVQLKPGDLKECDGTFGPYFDTYLSEIFWEQIENEELDACEVGSVMIRGFIFNKEELLKELKDLGE